VDRCRDNFHNVDKNTLNTARKFTLLNRGQRRANESADTTLPSLGENFSRQVQSPAKFWRSCALSPTWYFFTAGNSTPDFRSERA
jgi:hypothetical protein